MTTLFDIGDEIEVTLKGKVIEYTCSKDGDCYVVELTNIKPDWTRVYLSTPTLRNAVKINDAKKIINKTD